MDDRQNEKADVMLRAEIDRLRSDLQKSEDNLNTAEVDLDKQTNLVRELTRKVRPNNHVTCLLTSSAGGRATDQSR